MGLMASCRSQAAPLRCATRTEPRPGNNNSCGFSAHLSLFPFPIHQGYEQLETPYLNEKTGENLFLRWLLAKRCYF